MQIQFLGATAIILMALTASRDTYATASQFGLANRSEALCGEGKPERQGAERPPC